MKWKYLLIKKLIIHRLPFVNVLRKIKRIISGYPPDVGNMNLAIKNYGRIKQKIESMGVSIKETTILEIGSGWFPAIPILFARDGVKKFIMSDLHIHMDDISFDETVKFLKHRFPDDDFIQKLTTFDSLSIEYMAPFEVSELDDESVDVVISNNVLEHIPRSDLYVLFSSLWGKISDGGKMVHLIDNSDHFEHHDKSISRINFLTWTEERHALINYLIRDGENRLRHHEYRQVFEDAGFYVVDAEADIDDETLAAVDNLALVYPYSKMRPEELAVLTSIYALKKL